MERNNDMKLTMEQERQLLESDSAHVRAVNNSLNAAARPLANVCAACWWRSKGKCRMRDCAIGRAVDALHKINARLIRGKLHPNVWAIARNAADIADVPYLG